ncbi:MAG: asparagine synthase-related protein [Candidatus Geothermincolia bacterium]
MNKATYAGMLGRVSHRRWYKTEELISPTSAYALACISLGHTGYDYSVYREEAAGVTVCLVGQIYSTGLDVGDIARQCCNLYLDKGRDYISAVDANVVVLIVDERQRTVKITNDLVGSRPVFWCLHDGFLYIAPELKAFLAVPSLQRRIDEEAVVGFLCGGRMANNRTYFQGIEKLDYASTLTLAQGTVEIKPYWRHAWHIPEKSDRDLRSYASELGELLVRAAKKRLGRGKKTAVLLTGGIDSRLVFGSYLRALGAGPAFSVTYGVTRDIPMSDAYYARILSAENNTKNDFLERDPKALLDNFHQVVYLSDGSFDEPGNYAEGLGVYQRIRGELGIDSVMRGDEALGGSLPSVATDDDLLWRVDYQTISNMPLYQRMISKDKRERLLGLSNDLAREMLSAHQYRTIEDRADSIYFTDRLVARFGPLTYLKQIEIEVLSPLLDRDVLQFITTIPGKYRRDRGVFRATLKELYPSLARHGFSVTGNDVDWSETFRSDPHFKEFAFGLLIEETNGFDDYMEKEEVLRFLEGFFATGEPVKRCRIPWPLVLTSALKRSAALVALVHKLRGPWQINEESILFRLMTIKSFFKHFDVPSHET